MILAAISKKNRLGFQYEQRFVILSMAQNHQPLKLILSPLKLVDSWSLLQQMFDVIFRVVSRHGDVQQAQDSSSRERHGGLAQGVPPQGTAAAKATEVHMTLLLIGAAVLSPSDRMRFFRLHRPRAGDQKQPRAAKHLGRK